MPDAVPLYPPTSPEDLKTLISYVETQPITYGPWQQIKRLYKQAESDGSASSELLGALISCIDFALLEPPRNEPVIRSSRRGRVISVALSPERICVLNDAGPRNPAALCIYRLDPANPTSPQEMAVLPAPKGVSVLMCGMQAVLVSLGGGANDPKGITTFDCSGPAPTMSAHWIDRVRGICSDDRYLYISIESVEFTGVVIRELMPGSAPKIVGRIAIERVGEIDVDGNTLYALSGGQSLSLRGLPKPAGLRIVDVTQSERPRLVGSVKLAGASGVKASGGLAVVYRNRSGVLGAGLYMVDVRDPATASEIAFLGTGKNTRLITARGATAFATGEYGGLITIDLRDPRKPRIVPGGDHFGLACFDTHGTFAVGGNYAGVYLFNADNPLTLTPLNATPGRKTLAYMKRRTRRFLSRLANTDPDRFAAIAFSILSKQVSPVDASIQWQTMDLLYGGSDLYRQTRHGRGSYRPAASRFVFRRPVERGHEAWVRHSELAAKLLGIADLDSDVHELAYRTILTSGTASPEIGDALAARFLAGNSPILRYAAVHAMVRHLNAPLSMPPEAAADLYLAGGRSVRNALRDAIVGSANKNANWRKNFAGRLFEHAARRLPDIPLSRRESSALAFLARHLLDLVPAHKVAAFSGAFLKSGNTDLVDLALVSVRKENPASLPRWLADIETCSEYIRRQAVLALMEAVAGQPITLQVATSLAQSPSSFIRSAGWELLGASSTAEKVLRPLIQTILDKPDDDPVLQSMLGSIAALGLLHRAGIEMSAFMPIIRDRPALAGYLTADVLTTLMRDLPAEQVVNLIGSATDELWERMRPGLLRNVHEGFFKVSFWGAIGDALGGENAQELTHRILDDSELAASFVENDDDSMLDLTSPAMEGLTFAWVQRREERFVRGSDLLLRASTHRLVSIREWALARVRAQGMDVAFALRLLESELPASFDTGRTLFEAAAEEDVTRFALLLCDSPSASVRAFGRFYVRANWNVIPHAEMIRDLFEGGTPDMQGFTAELLETEAERPEAGPTFDRDILRTRSRARRAKESVKRRQEKEHSVDIATLTALARGGVKRDAEWALTELTKRALSGDAVEAVRIDGIAGG